MPVADMFPMGLRRSLPALRSQERVADPIVHLRFFSPSSPLVWYVTEGSPEDDDFVFFGFVAGVDPEWGYFSLSELTEASSSLARPIHCDPEFKPAPFSHVVRKKVT